MSKRLLDEVTQELLSQDMPAYKSSRYESRNRLPVVVPYARGYSRKLLNKPRMSRPSFRSQIKSIVKSMAETKLTSFTAVNESVTTANNVVVPYYIPLAPPLSQGSGQNNRVGNSVMVTQGHVEGYVNLLPYNATTNNFPSLKVRLMLVSLKNRNTTADLNSTLNANDFQTFFQSGGSGLPPQGTMYDMLAPINLDRWTLHAERHMTLSLGGSSTSYPDTTGPHEGSGTYQKYFKFDIAKALGKLLFDDTTGSQYPSNKNLYLVVQPVTTDGGPRQTGAVCEVHYNTVTKYKDM